jgi:hypothetical protein
MDEETFIPIKEIFKNYTDEEREHIQWLLKGLQTFTSNGNQTNNTRKAAAALRWVLLLLKDLEPPLEEDS